MDSNPSKAESIAQAAKTVYTELCKEFDEDTAKELLIASMPAITEDVVKPRAVHYYSGGIVDPEDECVIGGFGPETIVPLEDLTRTEPGWMDRLTRGLQKSMKTPTRSQS
ncbi:hypothetical protein [Paenibacillus glucanolyticus]|uniref:hypothetical protein n=1 Tax=Paenibacillus glucanolyticus TaxID=59843 RepID=UPI00128C11DF|nr:hypothetical protein [Paenibacillus glucanolyticus]MPY20628.1 hypothetical protein [Paenibacillus glucanolyticus]